MTGETGRYRRVEDRAGGTEVNPSLNSTPRSRAPLAAPSRQARQGEDSHVRLIVGIDHALRVLAPHWPAIEADFARQNERFLELARADHDAIGRVLRAHLVVENFLDQFLQSRLGIADLSPLRFSFAQKVGLLPESSSAAAFVKPGIKELNSVRNKYGHRLQQEVAWQEVRAISEILAIARRGASFESPLGAIEAFAPVACAFLGVPPAALADVFRDAFAQVVAPREEPVELNP